jgi:hypothetical protein
MLEFPKSEQPLSEGAIEAALRVLLQEAEEARFCGRPDRAVILRLCARVPEERRSGYLSRLAAVPLQADARGSDVFNKIVNIIDRYPQREWTNADLKRRIEESGMKVEAKRVGNLASYFVKCGRFERLARGQYRDRQGNVFVTSQELPTFDISRGGDNED